MNENKKYMTSKAIIIILSLITFTNGLGLIVAGKRVNKKSWVKWGIMYLVIQWICALLNIGVTVATLLYYVCVVHTALICSEYEWLLSQKEKNQRVVKQSKQNEHFDEQVEHMEEVRASSSQEKHVEFDDVQLGVGIAKIEGQSRDRIKICIQSYDGGKYEFDTKGHEITALKTNGRKYNYGG